MTELSTGAQIEMIAKVLRQIGWKQISRGNFEWGKCSIKLRYHTFGEGEVDVQVANLSYHYLGPSPVADLIWTNDAAVPPDLKLTLLDWIGLKGD